MASLRPERQSSRGKFQNALGLSDVHCRIIDSAFDEGLVTAYWTAIEKPFDDRMAALSLNKTTLAQNLVCDRGQLSRWPKASSELWLLLRHSIVLGLDLGKLSCPALRLLLGAYHGAAAGLAQQEFREISRYYKNDPHYLERLAKRILPIDVLIVLVSFEMFAENEASGSQPDYLLRLTARTADHWRTVADTVATYASVAAIPRPALTHETIRETIRTFFVPMSIVLSVMHYENWYFDEP